MDLSPHWGDAHCVGGRLRPLPKVGTWLITALTDSLHFITLITNLSPPSFLCCFLKFCLFDIHFFYKFYIAYLKRYAYLSRGCNTIIYGSGRDIC